MIDYREANEATEKFLDTLDILSYAQGGESLYALMDRIEDACSGMEEIQGEVFESNVFNWMSESEFEDYLWRRYGNKIIFGEQIIYNVTKGGVNDEHGI